MPIVDINGAAVEFPDNMSEEELNQAVSAAAGQVGAPQQEQGPGLMGKAWESLKVPAQMAQTGLDQIVHGDPELSNQFLSMAGPAVGIPQDMALKGIQKFRSLPTETGNLPYDVARGAPKAIGETMAEAAPQFVNRASIATGGALKLLQGIRPIASLGRQLAFGQAEKVSGIAPKAEGALERAYQEPSRMLAPGRKAVSNLYEGVKRAIRPAQNAKIAQMAETEQQAQNTANLAATRAFLEGKAASPVAEQIPSSMTKLQGLKDESSSLRYIKKAAALAKSGALPAEEALEARKMTAALHGSKQIPPQWLRDHEEVFDRIWKAAAGPGPDSAYKRALDGEMLRNISPQNLKGGASTMKMATGTALSGMGVPGKAILAALSPAAQGSAAAAAGTMTKQALNPLLRSPMRMGPGIQALLEALERRRSNASR